MQEYLSKIHTWGAQSWWQAAIVNGGGMVLGIVLMVFGAKYLPDSVEKALIQDIQSTHVSEVSGTTVSLP